MTMDWKELLARLQEEGNLPEGEETVCGDEENAVEEGQHGPLRVITDRKGRKGKTATIIEGFTLDDGGVADVAARLKKRLGTGGSARGGEILIQGDRRADLQKALELLGWKSRVC